MSHRAEDIARYLHVGAVGRVVGTVRYARKSEHFRRHRLRLKRVECVVERHFEVNAVCFLRKFHV